MIQDLGNKRIDIEYKNYYAEDKDVMIIFNDGKVLVKGELGGELELPSVLPEFRDELRYIFSIGEVKYFLFVNNFVKNGQINIKGFRWENPRALRQRTSKDVCFAVATAMHLSIWYRSNKFCGCCQAELEHDEKERAMVCPKCGNRVYPKIAPAVIVALIDGDRIMFTKYSDREYKKFALIAGFVEIGETAEDTVAREVMEEVGLRVKNIKYYKSQPWGVDSNLLLGYTAELDGAGDVTLDEDELSVAVWMKRSDIPDDIDDDISLTRDMMRAFKDGVI